MIAENSPSASDSPWKKVTGPGFLCLLAGVFWWLRGTISDFDAVRQREELRQAIELVPVLLSAMLVAMTMVALSVAFITRHLGSSPPRLIRQAIGVLCWGATIAVVAAWKFDVPIGSLVTTSGMLVAVIGFALKNMISDLFYGITLPLKKGEWIEADGLIGEVVEVSWRSTSLVTADQVMVIIPNTQLMSKAFRNYSRPKPFYRDSFKITLPNDVTAHQAERNLIAAARQVDLVAALPIAPSATITSFSERGIEWELKYPVPDAGTVTVIRHRIKRNVLRNLHYSGISLPQTVMQLNPAPQRPEMGPDLSADAVFLCSIDLFSALLPDELDALAADIRHHIVHAGRAIVRQGDDGESLFVLREGLLGVSIMQDGLETTVGQILPGSFFGEMSLLTGAPRGATVVPLVDSVIFEIGRETLRPLMNQRPYLAVQMSEVLAERQAVNLAKTDRREQIEEQKKSIAGQILGRINAIFRLKGGGLAQMNTVSTAT